MSKPNLKSQAKRKRELAKLDKRQAKDQKRADKKAERAGDTVVTPAPAPAPTPVAPKPAHPASRLAVVAPPAPKAPLTLAAAVLQWKTQKIPKAKTR